MLPPPSEQLRPLTPEKFTNPFPDRCAVIGVAFAELAPIVTDPENFPLPTTCNVAEGVDVPIPTLNVPSPSTIELLCETRAFAPMAVAFVSCVGAPGPDWKPIKVFC